MSDRRDMTKAAASLITDMVTRAAMQQNGQPPQQLTRRPRPMLPNLSPRGAELVNALLATRTPTLTPNTAPGGVQNGQPGVGSGGVIPDRATLLAQNPNAYDVGNRPLYAQQAGAGGGPAPSNEPTDPLQRYALGLSPLDDNGQPFPNWDQADSSYREAIWQQYAQATGLDLTGAQQGPMPQGTPNALPMGSFRPSETATDPAFTTPGTAPISRSVEPPENPQLTGVVQSGWNNPPPGWSEGPEDDADWQAMSRSQREKVWRLYAENLRRDAPTRIEPLPPSEQSSTPNPVGGLVRGGFDTVSGIASDIRESPPGQAVENYIVEPAIAIAGWAEHKNQQSAADSAYYMMTHDGELPPTSLDPRTWFQGWLLSGNGSQFNPGSEEYFAAVKIVDETAGEEPTDPSTWSPETVAAYIEATHTDPFATDGNSNPLAQATLLTYLNANPDKWTEATAAYEAGVAAGGNGSDALLEWFNQDVGGWWSFAGSIIMDPLNYALFLSIPGKALVGAADARTLARGGKEVDRINKARRAAGNTLRFAADPLSGVVEQGARGASWTGRRLIGGLADYGEAGAKRTAKEAAEEQSHVVGQTTATDAEAEANQLRREQAEATVAREQAEAAEEARKRGEYADMWTARKNQAEARQRSADESRAAREKRAAEIEIQRSIRAGDQRRARELQEQQRVAAQRRAEEARQAKADADRADAAQKMEAARSSKIEKARITRDTQIRTAATARGRQNAITRFEANLEKARIDYENAVADFERKHGMEPGSYKTELDTPVDIPPPPPEPVSQTTIYEEPRPGSNIDSAAQKQAEYDSMVLRRQQEREAQAAAEPAATPEPEVPRAPDTDPWSGAPPERIAVEVTQNGKTVTKDYLDPDYVSKGAPDEPNLARMVRDIYGPENPVAAEQFWNDYIPRAKQYMTEDAALADRIAERLRAAGKPVSRDNLETIERTIKRLEFNAESDALFEMRFGRRSPREVYRQFDTKAGKMHPNDPRSWLEHAVYGDNAADAAAAIAKIRGRKTAILRSRSNDQIADWAQRQADTLFGDIERAAPVETAPTPRTEATGTPAPEAPASLESLPERYRNMLDTYRDDILDADPDVSRSTAHLMHIEGRKLTDPAQKKLWRDTINDLRSQSGHETSRSRRAAKRKGTTGIVFDPWDKPTQFAEAVHSVMGKIVDRMPERLAGGPAKAAPNGVVIRSNVKYAEELRRAWEQNVSLTQRQVDAITTDVTLTLGTGKNVRTVNTNFWDRFMDNLADESAVRRGRYRKSGYPTTEEGWADEIKIMTEEREKALAKTNDEFSQLYAPSQSNKARRITHQAMGANRKYLQFNIITGPRAIFNDIVTNEKFMFLTGQGGAIRRQQRLLTALSRDHDDTLDILEHSVMKRVKDSGVTQLPPEMKHTIGREEVERTALRRAKLDPRNMIESYWIKRIRGAGDNASRYAIYANYFDGHLLEEQAKWLDFVRGKVRKNGNDDLWNAVHARVQQGDFTPDDIRAITKQFTNDDSYARTWAKQVDDLSQAATKKQRQIMFSYKKTRMDDALGKVFLFHYYMTRSTALYTKLMLQHPQLISMEAALWEASAENLKQFPGAPEWMHGFMGLALDNGHAFYTNPTMLLSGIGVLQSLGDGGWSRSKVEQALNTTGLFPQPMVRAALAVFGSALPGDPTGTTQLRRAIISTYDKIRFSDFGREHGWDKFGPEGPSPDWLQDGVNMIVNMANDAAREFAPQLKDFETANTGDVKLDQVKSILITNFQEEGGSDNPDEWPQDVYDRYVLALVALEDGVDNPDVDAAVDEYVDMAFEQTVGTVVSPTGAYVRDADTDTRQEREREARAVPYQERTPEQEAAVAVDDTEAMQSPQAVRLTEGMRKYNNAGTENQQIINQGVSQILFGYQSIPDKWTATIGGVTYTGAQLKAMSDDEREDLADTYEREEGARSGVIVGATAGDEQATPLTSFRAERERIKQANGDVADYTDYRSYMLNVPDKRKQREAMLATNGGDTEFAREHENFRQYLIGQGVTGEELETELDEWIDSDAAYLAAMGFAARNRGETRPAIYDAANPPPWRDEEEESSDFGGEFESVTGEAIDEGLDFSTMTIEEARDLVRTDSISPDGLEELVDQGTLDERTLRAWIRDGTLLNDDLYQMAAQPNLTATDIKYMREDGYMSQQELIRLIVDDNEAFVAEMRMENRRRKRRKERDKDTKRTTSGGYQPLSFLMEYTSPPGG